MRNAEAGERDLSGIIGSWREVIQFPSVNYEEIFGQIVIAAETVRLPMRKVYRSRLFV